MLPPTAWKQLADAQVDGWRRWDPEASPRPHRLWSRGDEVANVVELGCFRHQLLLPHPYLVLTKPLRLDIQCQRAASIKIGWKYLDN